jgi:thioredoxin
MNKIQIIILAIPILLNSCTEVQSSSNINANAEAPHITTPVVQSNYTSKNLSPQQFHKKMEFGGIILDVRTPSETTRGSITNASFININDPSFLDKINMMQKNQPILVYCASGSRSSHAAKLMTQNGFKEVYNLSGGIRAWLQSGFPVTKPKVSTNENIPQITLDEFQKITSTELPVLIDFHTAWCAPCKKMSPIVDQLKTAYIGQAKVLKIDVDQNTLVANQYGIRGVPVLIIFKNGKEVWRHSGVIETRVLKQIIDQYISK